jgi:hypothetical protein
MNPRVGGIHLYGLDIYRGSAKRPTPADNERLRTVKTFYRAQQIVLVECKRGEGREFSRLEVMSGLDHRQKKSSDDRCSHSK